MGRMWFAKHTHFIDPLPLIPPRLSVGRVDSLPPLDLQLLVGVNKFEPTGFAFRLTRHQVQRAAALKAAESRKSHKEHE